MEGDIDLNEGLQALFGPPVASGNGITMYMGKGATATVTKKDVTPPATILCMGCGKPTFDNNALPVNTDLRPFGLTMGNARHHLRIRGKLMTLCANCRYDTYAAW